jgi:hypothetical protein
MTRPYTKLHLNYTPAPTVAPISFTGAQLDTIMAAARSLPIESRDAFLRLIAQQLKIRDIDVVDRRRSRAALFESGSVKNNLSGRFFRL